MRLLEQWALIEADLQDVGLDLGDPQLFVRRTWPWLKTRIYGLLAADTRLRRALVQPPPPPRL